MNSQTNRKNVLLTIVIPALNEEKRLPDTLNAVSDYLKNFSDPVELIIVDDGSSDRTAAVARELGVNFNNFRVISLDENRGKGFAVKVGVLAAEGEYILFMDADNSTPVEELEKLRAHSSSFPIVIGSRIVEGANVEIEQPWYRIMISRLGNAAIRSLVIEGIKDTQCGFKLFQGAAAKNIFSLTQIQGWGFDIETLAIAEKVYGYPIKEVPVSWYDSADSRLRPIRGAWQTLVELVRIKWNLMAGKYRKDG